MNNDYNKLLRLIIGENTYKLFLNSMFEFVYKKYPEIKVNNIEILLNQFGKIILSLSFNNIELKELQIKLINNEVVTFKVEDIKNIFRDYIEKVIEFKNDLLTID